MFVSFPFLFPLKRKDEFPNFFLHLKVLFHINPEKIILLLKQVCWRRKLLAVQLTLCGNLFNTFNRVILLVQRLIACLPQPGKGRNTSCAIRVFKCRKTYPWSEISPDTQGMRLFYDSARASYTINIYMHFSLITY